MNEPHICIATVDEVAAQGHPRAGGKDIQTVEQKFLEYFGLNEQPFGVTPDPRFLYLGPKHRQALTALDYGTESNRGFLTLIARPGMGKTSLLFQYLESLRHKARTVFLFQTAGDSRDLMCYLLADLGLDGAGKDLPEMHSILNQVLMEEMRAGRRFVLVIDEAQNLTDKVLESVRLLSNFETPWAKLLQIVLAGQPQLAERLAEPSMVQLRQRVSLSIRIEPLTSEEVSAYVDHRLSVAGHRGSSLFSVGARTLLAESSEGIPRNMNNICFCAMSLCWATKQKTIDGPMMQDILTDLNLGSLGGRTGLVAKSADELDRPVLQNPPRPVLTIKESPSRGWLPKIAVASAVLFALSWVGIHFDIGKRLAFSTHMIVGSDKSSAVPMLTPTLPGPATATGSQNTSPSPILELPRDGHNLAVPQQLGLGSPISSRVSD